MSTDIKDKTKHKDRDFLNNDIKKSKKIKVKENENENINETKCKFCKTNLLYGFDTNFMIHCQHCHNIWDGYAQCSCSLP